MSALAEWATTPLGFLACCLVALAIFGAVTLGLVAMHELRIEDGPPETHP